jgi:hypothetical protein
VGEGLLSAAADFLAAVLRAVGYVGRPRRRAGIREDLELLTELEKFPDFGPGSFAHRILSDHIRTEVARLAGHELGSARRKIPWASVVLAAVIGAPLGFFTYRLDENGFRWYSIFPGAGALLMLVAIFGMFLPEQEAPIEEGDGAGKALEEGQRPSS